MLFLFYREAKISDMSKPTNTTLIGVFVLGGIALLIAAIVILGSGRFFSNTVTCIAYFNGSVKGLTIGSTVRFRGAVIGKVTDIHLEIRKSETGEPLLPVTFDLITEKVNRIEGRTNSKSYSQAVKVIKNLIQQGVKASLAMDSIVTGQLYVDLDYHPTTPIVYLGETRGLPEIPTSRSPFEKIKDSLQALPINDVISSANDTLKSIDEFFSSKDLSVAIKSVNELTTKATESLNLINNLTTETESAVTQATKTLKSIERAATTLHDSTNPTSPLRYKLISTMNEIEKASRSFQILSDFLQRNPEALLYGKHGDNKFPQEKNR